MGRFWQELQDMASSPDFLAILVLSLLLGWGPQLCRRQTPELWPLPVLSRPWTISPAIPLQEALEEPRWELRLPR